jgi:hypothetical protein
MLEDLSEHEFDSLLRKVAPHHLHQASTAQVEGSRRRCPFELAVFQDLPAESKFTANEWSAWTQLVLHAFELLGEPGFELLPEIRVGFVTAANSDNQLTHRVPPIFRMLRELEAAGYIRWCHTHSSFCITAEGRGNLLSRQS